MCYVFWISVVCVKLIADMFHDMSLQCNVLFVCVCRTCVCWGTGRRWPSLPSGTSTGGSHMTCWPGWTTSNAAWTNCLTPPKERGSRWQHTYTHIRANIHTYTHEQQFLCCFSSLYLNHEAWYPTWATIYLCLPHHPALHLFFHLFHTFFGPVFLISSHSTFSWYM